MYVIIESWPIKVFYTVHCLLTLATCASVIVHVNRVALLFALPLLGALEAHDAGRDDHDGKHAVDEEVVPIEPRYAHEVPDLRKSRRESSA